jgi:hypothetical protein
MRFEPGTRVLVEVAADEWWPGVIEDLVADGTSCYVRTGPGQMYLRPDVQIRPQVTLQLVASAEHAATPESGSAEPRTMPSASRPGTPQDPPPRSCPSSSG